MFTQTPNNLASLYSELKYTYYSTYTEDLTLQIYENETDELLGVKKFYSTNSAQLNIAPHIRPYAMPTIDIYSMGFITPYRNCNVGVYLKVAESGDISTPLQFSLSRRDISTLGVISSLPRNRTIAGGESEQIYIAAQEGDNISIEVKRYISEPTSDSTTEGEYQDRMAGYVSYSTIASDGDIEVFNMVAESSKTSDKQIEWIEVSISRRGVFFGEVVYNVVENRDSAVRLAWVSESGSIEHYTFPVVNASSTESEGRHSTTLTSAYEGYATRVALSNIVRSPMVWVLRGGEYERVRVMDSVSNVIGSSLLGTVDIKISCND